MSTFADALAALAALPVSGVTASFAIEDLPEQPDRAQLPALLIVPSDRIDRLFPARGEGLTTLAFGSAAATFTAPVSHLLLIAAQDSGMGSRQHWPRLVAIVDAYFAALKADPLLGGTLAEPPHVRVDAGTVDYGGVRYIGAAFRHLWTLEVTA